MQSETRAIRITVDDVASSITKTTKSTATHSATFASTIIFVSMLLMIVSVWQQQQLLLLLPLLLVFFIQDMEIQFEYSTGYSGYPRHLHNMFDSVKGITNLW